MLFSVAVDPAVFGPSVICDRQTRDQAVGLLRGILENGIILTTNREGFAHRISENVAALSPGMAKRIEICVSELLQGKRRYLAMPGRDASGKVASVDSMFGLATVLGADAVVCGEADGMRVAEGLSEQGIEVVDLRDYSDSCTEKARRNCLAATRLDTIERAEERDGYVGRAVKYARRVSLVDRYFSAATGRKGGRRLEKYARGAVYVARQWARCSPYAREGPLELEVITVAGRVGGTVGYIDPGETRLRLEKALRAADREGVVGAITVTTKQDENPRLLRERFLEAKGRCWGIRHGIDSLAELEGSSGTGPTFIDPASQHYMDLVSEVRELRDAE